MFFFFLWGQSVSFGLNYHFLKTMLLYLCLFCDLIFPLAASPFTRWVLQSLWHVHVSLWPSRAVEKERTEETSPTLLKKKKPETTNLSDLVLVQHQQCAIKVASTQKWLVLEVSAEKFISFLFLMCTRIS